MSENVDNEEGIPEGITGDFSLNKLLEKEAEKIKKRQGNQRYETCDVEKFSRAFDISPAHTGCKLFQNCKILQSFLFFIKRSNNIQSNF